MEAVVRHKSVRSDPDNVSITKLYLWVLSYLRPYRKTFALLIGCSLFITLIEMSIPKLIQYFIDVILPKNEEKLFYMLLVATAIMIGFMYALTVTRNNMQRNIQELAGRDLQLGVYRQLHRLGFAYYEKHPVGETLSLLNTEVSAVQQIYQSYLPKLIQHLLFVAVMTAAMFLMQWQLTLAVLPCFFTFYLFAPYLSKKTSQHGRQRTENSKFMNKRIYDSFMALPELRANGSEKWDLSRLLDAVSAYNKSDVMSTYYALVRGFLRGLSISMGAIVLFAYGSYMVQTLAITVGEFIAFLFYYFMSIGMFTFIVMSVAAQKALMFQAEVIYRFMRRTPEVQEPDHPVPLSKVKGELHFRDVSFDYPDRSGVLRHFNLHIHPGEKVAIVGASGTGKSTIMKLIGRFYDPIDGEIVLDGVPLPKLSISKLRDSLGFVFQDTYLFHQSIRENIRFGRPEATDEEVEAAAIAAYAHHFIMQMPDGYDTVVGERGSKLSGGQKQRIALARMLVKNPSVILLDEATSALDYEGEREVGQAMETLFENRTIVAAAHRLSTIRTYSRIVYMADGQVAESGSYEELMSRKQLFYKLVNGGTEENG
ncbi:ABC transporter ATP-binding protein [Paenibacillus mesophilus]|uniref:ABC transporter ATP-binding protein n=1 Tax=Paenibacillus mesophilus TaxID=2582849 RepID=UPI00110DC356|nr:ABC transporter ATP-binding protein [Paenibacillus mesophilus]TMV50117.1 ABC transporter ATP-binding protein [Paenibacillus mesophilus]